MVRIWSRVFIEAIGTEKQKGSAHGQRKDFIFRFFSINMSHFVILRGSSGNLV